MAILILGPTGQLGRELLRIFPNAVAIDRLQCDLLDEGALTTALERLEPSCVINAAAYTNVEGAENDVERAQRINATAPAILASFAAQRGISIVHYSTDYVFDGCKTERYVESDVPQPLNVYGASKLAGEKAICAACESGRTKYYILRTSWLYGWTPVFGGNFIKTVIRLAQEQDSLRIVADQYGVPTSARWLAHITRDLLEVRPNTPSGIYHAVPSGETTWHGFAVYAVSEAIRLGMPIRALPSMIEAISTTHSHTRALRPRNSRLDNTKLAVALHSAGSFPCWKTQVSDYIAELQSDAAS